jgi:hypothetical protein
MKPKGYILGSLLHPMHELLELCNLVVSFKGLGHLFPLVQGSLKPLFHSYHHRMSLLSFLVQLVLASQVIITWDLTSQGGHPSREQDTKVS